MIEFLNATPATGSVSPIDSLLSHLSEVSGSPLAFVAYGLVVAGWVVTIWLSGNPERKTENILNQFKDDKLRLRALAKLAGKDPPQGLTGNEAILQWVNANYRSRSRMLFLVGWTITLIAVLMFLVAWRATPTGQSKQISVVFHRQGTVSDCPDLGERAHLKVAVGSTRIADVPVVERCRATLPVTAGDKRIATVSLADVDGYSLADEHQQYSFALDNWYIYLTTSEQSRVRLSIFNYAGECPGGSSAYMSFQELLKTKVNALRDLFAPTDRRFDYLSHLYLVPTGGNLDLSTEQVREYANRTSSLQVLSGMCFINDKTEVMRSQIFSGNLHGDLSEPLTANMPLVASEFGTTREIHTAAILYALAQDASERGLASDIVIQYLSHAREKLTNTHDPVAEQLTHAIDTMLLRNGAQKPMVLAE